MLRRTPWHVLRACSNRAWCSTEMPRYANCDTFPRMIIDLESLTRWWRDLFRCRIDLLNFSMGFNIIAPYMEFLHLNWYTCIAECSVYTWRGMPPAQCFGQGLWHHQPCWHPANSAKPFWSWPSFALQHLASCEKLLVCCLEKYLTRPYQVLNGPKHSTFEQQSLRKAVFRTFFTLTLELLPWFIKNQHAVINVHPHTKNHVHR